MSSRIQHVWHKGLLHKLRAIGCSGKALAWVSSHLSGRRKRVALNGKFPKWVEALLGSPKDLFLALFSFSSRPMTLQNVSNGGSIRLFADGT